MNLNSRSDPHLNVVTQPMASVYSQLTYFFCLDFILMPDFFRSAFLRAEGLDPQALGPSHCSLWSRVREASCKPPSAPTLWEAYVENLQPLLLRGGVSRKRLPPIPSTIHQEALAEVMREEGKEMPINSSKPHLPVASRPGAWLEHP